MSATWARQASSWLESSEATDSGSSSDRGAITPNGVSSSGSTVGNAVVAGVDSVDGGLDGVVGAAAVGDGACVGVVVTVGVGSSGACVGPEQPIKAASMRSAAVRVSFCTVGLFVGVFGSSGIISPSRRWLISA